MAWLFLVSLTVGLLFGYLGPIYVAIDITDRLLHEKSCQGRLVRLLNVDYRHCRLYGTHLRRWNVLSMGLTGRYIHAVGLRCCIPSLSFGGMEGSVSAHHSS